MSSSLAAAAVAAEVAEVVRVAVEEAACRVPAAAGAEEAARPR
jgi:hypothetical protein